MPTPMISFRLDPQLTSMMDARCQDLNISRAEFLRGLIVGEVGSPVTATDGTDVQAAIDGLGQKVGELDTRMDQMGADFEAWVSRKLGEMERRLGDRIGRLEARLGQR